MAEMMLGFGLDYQGIELRIKEWLAPGQNQVSRGLAQNGQHLPSFGQ
jgi:hypothetical protein